MAGLKGEQAAAVLQADAGARYHHAGAERLVKAVDKRDAVTLAVSHRQVNGIAIGFRITRHRLWHRLIPVDELPSPPGIRPGEQFLQGDSHEIGVGHIPAGIGKAQLQRLYQQVQVLRGVMSQGLQVIALQDI